MRFALLGNHPDGLELASALVESGRHELVLYTGAHVPADHLHRWGETARHVQDLEEALADPAVEVVIVAGTYENRPYQLRRALQAERHVLCVHPPDFSPDIAYEAAMIQKDTGKILMPLLPEGLHPAMQRLASLCRGRADSFLLGRIVLIDVEDGLSSVIFSQSSAIALPRWNVLMQVGGEITELSAYAESETPAADRPILLTGRFRDGGLFRASYLPNKGSGWRLAITGEAGHAELHLPHGWPGPALLSWFDTQGELQEEAWDLFDPWSALVQSFETIVGLRPVIDLPHGPTWQDAVRSLELDDAVRRSIERRRAVALEYPEPTEEAGFKGTMTLMGCGLLWMLIVLMVAATWLPWLLWVIVPVLVLFLGLQIFRWVIPRAETLNKGRKEQEMG